MVIHSYAKIYISEEVISTNLISGVICAPDSLTRGRANKNEIIFIAYESSSTTHRPIHVFHLNIHNCIYIYIYIYT